MNTAITSLPREPRLRGSAALLACVLAAGGCHNGPADPCGAQSCLPEPRQLTDEQIEALVEACNYKTTFEVNTGLVCPVGPGYSEAEPEVEDPFAPTEACRELLLDLWTWEATWFFTYEDLLPLVTDANPDKTAADIEVLTHLKAEHYARELQNTLSGLHALFFHPLFVHPDGALFFADASYPATWAEDFAVAELPAAGSFVLHENYYNRQFLLDFYSSVSKIHAYDEPAEVWWHMEWADLENAVTVERGFARAPDIAEAKYSLAPSFAHELGHAMKSPDHNPAHRDPNYGDAYTLGAAFTQAMLFGAAYSRMPGKDAYIGDWDIGLAAIDTQACKFFLEKVEPLALAHVENDCYSTAFWDIFATRPAPNVTVSELPCQVDEVACDPTELTIESDGDGGLVVTVPRWILNYIGARLDAFVLDATTHATTVTVSGEPFAGFAIDWLHPDGLAALFGLEEGDVVYIVDGYPATDVTDVLRGVDALTTSGSAAIRVARGGDVVSILYVLAP